jgi:thiamine pyrophosphate-dependent acetolactate synthase large subunit-like protein
MDTGSVERPLPSAANTLFGSDIVADTLRALDIPWIALTPGASYRGLHDSLVNHLGNKTPQMLVCLHEEAAVALAHGWAKVTGRPMAAAVHSNVGLFHATMAIFNAWCDRAPVLVIGATGPVDAAKRRPWIDWIHTAQDQGAIVRPYVKWDAQPASPAAAREALLRATWLARTAPAGPVYVNLDAGMQEAVVTEPLPPIEPARFMPQPVAAAAPQAIAQAAAMLRQARHPVILMGRVSRDEAAWQHRVALADALGARVATDGKTAAAFPTDHALHIGAPATFPSDALKDALRAADLILSLDWVDLGGTLLAACGPAPAGKVIQVSLDHQLHNGWSMDHQALPAVDLLLPAEPDGVVAALLAELDIRPEPFRSEPAAAPQSQSAAGPVSISSVAHTLRAVTAGRPVSLLHLPLGWNAADWPLRHPLDYIGGNGGAGVGAGPGMAVGAALALRDSGRLPVAVVGDGDFLMGVTALWTAVHYHIPLLVIVANNRSFFNDEVHQERVARTRGRPVENRWIGQRLADPEIDLAQLGAAQGTAGFGPIRSAAELSTALLEAIAHVTAGGVAVVDVRVEPGYSPPTARGMTRDPATERGMPQVPDERSSHAADRTE